MVKRGCTCISNGENIKHMENFDGKNLLENMGNNTKIFLSKTGSENMN
jgi:hypothetical protein